MQLAFLPEIDPDETKRNVESLLEKNQMYLLMDPEDMQPKITSTFQLTPPSNMNAFHSSTEDTAIQRIELDMKRKSLIKKVLNAVNRLNYEERSVIIKRYFGQDDVFDYEVYNNLGFSERKYYRVKSRAFYKIAFYLRLEVYKEGDDE